MPKPTYPRRALAFRVNNRINDLITWGRYRAALDCEEGAPDGPDEASLLIQINLAEAEYNLGRWDLAERRTRACFERAERFSITRAGCRHQLAWVLAHVGRADAALPLCASVDPLWLPEPFRAEHHFTQAVVRLFLGDLEGSERALKASEDELLRPSSVRNYLFLAARLAQAKGDRTGAEVLCQEAAENTYVGQGGDGLVLWGDLLAQKGAHAAARMAWTLALERDPESAWAEIARVRLAPGRP